MTNQATVVSAALVERVSERAAREQSSADIPLIVLDEMLNDSSASEWNAQLESAKVLLVAAYRSANSTSGKVVREDACVA
ncbi:MAG: hypothetical protein O2983_02835 [Planctomycetota bacterium]|nr:hypothetical protein [Planctomycetota bacterium]MDA1158522.1 hypothetical protein [Planctomycetota bacterium]